MVRARRVGLVICALSLLCAVFLTASLETLLFLAGRSGNAGGIILGVLLVFCGLLVLSSLFVVWTITTGDTRWACGALLTPFLCMSLHVFVMGRVDPFLWGFELCLRERGLDLEAIHAWRSANLPPRPDSKLALSPWESQDEWPECIVRLYPNGVHVGQDRHLTLEYGGGHFHYGVAFDDFDPGDLSDSRYRLGPGAYLYAH